MTPRDPEDAAPRRAGPQVHGVRAGIVVACFVAAVLLLLGPASHRLGATSTTSPHSTTTTTLKPKNVVTVQVANGTSTPQLAGRYTHTLQLLNWGTLAALDSTTHPSKTIVYFLPGYQVYARQVMRDLGLNPNAAGTVLPNTGGTGVAGASGDDVVVVLGPNLAG